MALRLLTEPGERAPELLEWSSLMVFQPPSTEDELYDDTSYTKSPAGCMSADIEETESPVVEKDSSYQRLSQIVGETHLSVWCYLYEPVSG